MKQFCTWSLVLLFAVTAANAQPNNKDSARLAELKRDGDEMLDELPSVPKDVDEHFFYELTSGDGGIGWMEYKLDSIRKRGEYLYRYQTRFCFDGKRIGWVEGQASYYVRKDFTPVRCENDFLQINPQAGKNNIQSKAVFKDGEMKNRRYSRGNVEDQTLTVPEGNTVLLLEPLYDKLALEDKQKFVLTYYEPLSNNFGSYEYEALKRDGGEFRISTKQLYEARDPNDPNGGSQGAPPPPQDPNNPDADVVKVREGYIIVDGQGSFKKRYDGTLDLTYERTNKERIIEIRKKLYEMLQDDDS